jgi:uncharacterized integral membrane protein
MAIFYLILALIIAVVAVIFAWQNSLLVTVTFFAWKVEGAPLSLVLLITLAIGILIGWLFVAPSLVKNSFRASGHRKRIDTLEKELEGHKAKLTDAQKPAPAAKPVEPKPAAPAASPESDSSKPA